MREKLEERLTALRQEFDAGRRMLADLEARQGELRQTLLRIGGAVQVLEELLAAEEPGDEDAPADATADGRAPVGAGTGPV